MTFDPLAPRYDQDFTQTASARYLRGRVHARLNSLFPAGSRIVELGCGTGEDALYLAERGIDVTATDISPAMLTITAGKTAHTGKVITLPLDLNAPQSLDQTYAGAFANFGALNCVRDFPAFAQWLKAHVEPGGIAAFGVMSPLCLWEIAWHSLHADFRTAFRRQRKNTTFQADSAAPPLPIQYPSVRTLVHAFAPRFKCVHVEPLGLFLPPSDVYGAIEKRPALFRLLKDMDSRMGRAGWLANFADHYWIEFKRL